MLLDCYNILKKIEFNPVMFLGEKTLKAIHIFECGYQHALMDNNITKSYYPADDPFHEWIANKLGYYESTAGWVNIINAHTLKRDPKNPEWDEFLEIELTKEENAKAVDLFYELLEEFKNSLN